MTQPQYFEDFEIGMVSKYGRYEVTAEEIIEFASKYDPQSFHLTEAAGKAMHFGGLCASGCHTCAMVTRMVVVHWVRPASTNCAGKNRYIPAIYCDWKAL